MNDMFRQSRRQFVASALGVTVGLTAGCQGFLSADESPTDTATPTDAATATPTPDEGEFETVESFDASLEHWNRNGGVGAESGVQGSVVHSGDGALELVNVAAADASFTSLPDDGLETYPSLGDDVSVWVRNGGGDRPKLGLCYLWQTVGSYTQSPGSGYSARIEPAADRIGLTKTVDGEEVIERTSKTEPALEDDTWYRIVVTTTAAGDHVFRLENGAGDELARASMQDDEWESGGYGVAYSGNETHGRSSFWDELTIST